jgi:hypothetical protein
MGRRQAQVWKKQQDMTNLSAAIMDKETLQEKLRVKIALQMMRKAYINGSSADRTRIKLHKLAAGDINAFDEPSQVLKRELLRKRNEKKHFDYIDYGEDKQNHDIDNRYLEVEQFQVKPFNQIMKDAKESYLIRKDRLKVESDGKKCGQLRPVCTSLIEHLKKERIQELKEQRKQRKKARQDQDVKPKGLMAVLAQRRMSHLADISGSMEETTTEEGYDESMFNDSSIIKTSKQLNEQLPPVIQEHNEGEDEEDWREMIQQNNTNTLFSQPLAISIPSHDPADDLQQLQQLDPPKTAVDRSSLLHLPQGKKNKRETFIIPQSRQSALILDHDAEPIVKPSMMMLNGKQRPNSASVSRNNNPTIAEAIAIAQQRALQNNWFDNDNAKEERNISSVPKPKKRPSSAISSRASFVGKVQRPTTRQSTLQTRQSTLQSKMTSRQSILQTRKSTLQRVNTTQSDLLLCQTVSFDSQYAFPIVQHHYQQNQFQPFEDQQSPPNSRPSSPLPSPQRPVFTRTPSVIIKASSVEDDENILRAQKKRDELIQEKETKLIQKINDREHLAETKLQFKLRQERQKAWLILLALQLRIQSLKTTLITYRNQKAWSKTNNKIKKAINIIKRWWKKQAVKLIFYRYPKARIILANFFVFVKFHLKFRKKNRSMDLIKMFLIESGMISESMMKIYQFRQEVIKIQRYVRSWFDDQQHRVRVRYLHDHSFVRFHFFFLSFFIGIVDGGRENS